MAANCKWIVQRQRAGPDLLEEAEVGVSRLEQLLDCNILAA